MLTEKHSTFIRSDSWESIYHNIVKEWVKECIKFPQIGINIVFVPNFNTVWYLKERLINDGYNIFGVRFMIIHQFWEFLHKKLTPEMQVARREDIYLIIKKVANQYGGPVGSSFYSDPASICRIIDALLRTECLKENKLLNKTVSDIIHEVINQLYSMNLYFAQDIEKEFINRATISPPFIDNLLVFGFNSSWWHIANLIKAGIKASKRSNVCAVEPLPESPSTELLWISTFEKYCINSTVIGSNFSGSKLNEGENNTRKINFYIAENIEEESIVILMKINEWLKKPCNKNIRIGVAIPPDEKLYHLLANNLKTASIPFHDGIRIKILNTIPYRLWKALILFIKDPTIENFIALSNINPRIIEKIGLNIDNISTLYKTLKEEYVKSYSNKLETILRLYGIKPSSIFNLPCEDTVENYLEFMNQIIAELDLEALQTYITQAKINLEKVPGIKSLYIQKELFISWLEMSTIIREKAPYEYGDNPFSPLHIVTYSDAAIQSWTYLILSGMNEGSWPSKYTDTTLMDGEFINTLNSRNIKPSPYGDGEWIINGTTCYQLSAIDRMELAKNIFLTAIENVEMELSLTASLKKFEGKQIWYPSEHFINLYTEIYHQPLLEEALLDIYNKTKQLIEKHGKLNAKQKEDGSILTISEIINRRKNPEIPFGEYDFACFPSTPFTARAFEKMCKSPELVWYEDILKLHKMEWRLEEIIAENTFSGNIIHTFMMEAVSLMKTSELEYTKFQELLVNLKNRKIEEFKNSYSSIPSYIKYRMGKAFDIAIGMALTLYNFVKNNMCSISASEHPFGPVNIYYEDDIVLNVKGRIDLILKRGKNEIFIIDYKSSEDADISPSNIAEGDGLQLLIYGILAINQGYEKEKVNLGILTGKPEIKIKSIDELLTDKAKTTLNILKIKQKTGILGRKSNPLKEYSYFGYNYPIATLYIPEDILIAKEKKFIEKIYSEKL